MKTMTKRTLTAVLACIMACVMFSMPVLAATTSTGFISKSTPKLNAFSGGQSNVATFSSGSVPADASITSVKIAYNVSSGTDPYTVYLISPSGTVYVAPGPTSSTTVSNISVFNGENPSGTWTAYIINSGYTTHGNIYPVSTVILSVTINYKY